MTMIQKSVPSNKYGGTVSAYQFYTILAGCAATLIIGYLVNLLNASANPVMIGRILAGVCTTAYVGSITSWHFAGKAFKKKLGEEDSKL